MISRKAAGLFILIMALILIFTPAGPQISGHPGSESGYTSLLQQWEGEPNEEPQPPPEEEPEITEDEPVIPEEEPVIPEEEPAIPEEELIIPEEEPIIPEEEWIISEEESIIPEETIFPEESLIFPEETVIPEELVIPEEGELAIPDATVVPEIYPSPETVPGDDLFPDSIFSLEGETVPQYTIYPPGDTLPPDTEAPDEDSFPPDTSSPPEETYPPEEIAPVEPYPPETSEEPTVIPEEPTAIPEEPTEVPEEPTVVPEEPTGIPIETATPFPTEEVTPEPSETAMPLPTETATPLPTETVTPVPEYSLIINIEGEGRVIREPEAETYPEGTEVLLTAVPGKGWLFNFWSGDLEGVGKQQKVVITREIEVTAVFIKVTTLPATDITTDSAIVNGELSLSPAQPVEVSFEYGKTSSLGSGAIWGETEVTGQSSTEILQYQPATFFAMLQDLSPSTLYYYRAKVVMGDQTAHGEILTFTTQALPDGKRSDWFVSPKGNDETGDGSKARPFRTIRRALEAASDGHRIRIYPGTYSENLVVNKSVDILGESGKSTDVVIDGGRRGNVIEMGNIKCSIKNLTVANGKGHGIRGGNGGRFVLQNLIVKGNDRGVYVYFEKPGANSAIVVRNCRFHSNGTGIFIEGPRGTATIQHNVLENNHNYGINLADARKIDITGNTIKRNGRGIYTFNAEMTVTGNTIEGNSSDGVYFGHTDINFARNIIRGNGGHGIDLLATAGDITNNLIVNNKKNGIQGNDPSKIANNTITGNNGGVILPYSDGKCRIINNIMVWNGEDFRCKTRAAYCNIGTGNLAGSSNISADPLFVNPSKGDYHLRSGSPCIDAGTSSGAPGTDLDGNKRPYGRGVDMGCYESRYSKKVQSPAPKPPAPPKTTPPKAAPPKPAPEPAPAPAPKEEVRDYWWVSIEGSDETGDGTRENPFRTIRKAIAEAAAGDTVHVLPGIYKENLEITKNLIITGESEKAEEVVINGEKKGAVIKVDQVKLLVKKLTVENGEKYGLVMIKSNCTLEGVIIKDNDGDGVYAEEGTLNMKKCQVYGNSGTGILVKEVTMAVTESHIHSNKNGIQGVACQALISDNVIEKCQEAGINFREYRASIKKNTVRENSYGIVASGSLDIENNVVVKNSKAGIFVRHSPVKINNNTVSENENGIVVDEGYREYRFYNNISWGNARADISGPVSSIHSNVGSGNTSGDGNLRDDPQFENPEQGDYQLKSGSPVVDRGTSEGSPGEDIAGNKRPADGDKDGEAVTDMGAYEYTP